MSAFLGTLGRLIPIYSNPSMDVTGIPERFFQTTLEGRVKAQVRPVGRRLWSLSAAYASPGELAALMDFATGVWGNGPFVWVSPTAPAINLLTPGIASCGPEASQNAAITVGGPVLLPDGTWVGRSLVNSNTAIQMWFGPATIPVVVGSPVTASAYVLGAGAQVTLQFFDMAGAVLSTHDSPAAGVAGTLTRLSVTATPPVGSASCRIIARLTAQAVRPAITWTSQVMEWGPGEGCDKAIVESASREALTGSTNIYGRRDSNLSFTIKEVG